MTDADRAALKILVEQIVDDLFTNGSGQKANRLVMAQDDWGKPMRDLGGWSRMAVKSRISALLAAGLSEAPAPQEKK